jgi:hypothetical protein
MVPGDVPGRCEGKVGDGGARVNGQAVPPICSQKAPA